MNTTSRWQALPVCEIGGGGGGDGGRGRGGGGGGEGVGEID